MNHSRFSLAPVPQFGATLALLIAAYSTPVLAMFGSPQGAAAASAAAAALESETVAAADGEPEPAEQAPRYICPMHPEVESDKPGRCPHCGMKLEEKKKAPELRGSP